VDWTPARWAGDGVYEVPPRGRGPQVGADYDTRGAQRRERYGGALDAVGDSGFEMRCFSAAHAACRRARMEDRDQRVVRWVARYGRTIVEPLVVETELRSLH
jgi:hypothetical protein